MTWLVSTSIGTVGTERFLNEKLSKETVVLLVF